MSKEEKDTNLWQCPKCKRLFKIELDYIGDGYIGKCTEPHECGTQKVIITPYSEEKIKFWKGII